jgi:hypothetical protein
MAQQHPRQLIIITPEELARRYLDGAPAWMISAFCTAARPPASAAF